VGALALSLGGQRLRFSLLHLDARGNRRHYLPDGSDHQIRPQHVQVMPLPITDQVPPLAGAPRQLPVHLHPALTEAWVGQHDKRQVTKLRLLSIRLSLRPSGLHDGIQPAP
jgi:hypothetical protein